MQTFDTPEPISVTLELSAGTVRLIASDRADTVVAVRPADGSRKSQASAEEQTRVEFANDRLLVKAQPRGLANYIGFGWGDAIEVTIELPAGSRIQGEGLSVHFHGQGRLGDCEFQTMSGGVWLEQAGSLRFSTTSGDLTVGHATGHVEVSSMSSRVRIDQLDSTAVIENAFGDLAVGETFGHVQLASGKGRLSADRVHANFTAKTGAGDVRVGEIIRGSVDLATGTGAVEVGIAEGTAAWVDAISKTGTVHSSLQAQDGPDQFGETAELRVRSYRDVIIRRSSVSTPT